MLRHLVSLGLLILVTVTAFSGESWEEAAILERTGDIEGAIKLYVEWLEKNPGGKGSGDVLIHTASLFENIGETINLLRNYAARVDTPSPVWARLAGLESSMGLPVDAAGHYRLASDTPGVSASRWRLNSLILLYSVGDFETVRRDADLLSAIIPPGILRDEAVSLAALALAGLGSPESALKELDTYIAGSATIYSPLVWLAMLEISVNSGDQTQRRRAETSLEAKFPGSAAHYLSSSRILEWTTPGSYLNAPAAPASWVQAGAFATRESAANLRYRLENAGFTSWIEQSGDLWRVLVNDADGNVMDRLTSAGFQGLF